MAQQYLRTTLVKQLSAILVADTPRVWRIDKKGKLEEFATAKAFPIEPRFLSGITVDEVGTLYVADYGTTLPRSEAGMIYRIDGKGKVSVAGDAEKEPAP